ncbi:ankyrin repeat domain-containing protein [Candidatus Dependentiae bacterium]|nr:ankyrin repeat domain-containing protein [Candidatus Dependentiae bacterium]
MDLITLQKPLIFDALDPFNREQVIALLEDGADPNIEFEGIVPLRIAIRTNNAELVLLLLLNGANVCVEDADIYNFLNEAVNSQTADRPGDTLAIIELLLAYGLNPNKLPHNGHLAFECLLCCGLNYNNTKIKELTYLFLSHNAYQVAPAGKANPFVAAAAWADKKLMQAFLSAGASPNTQDGWGITPLMNAAQKNRISTLKLLLDLGALVDTQSYTTKITALHSAASSGRDKALTVLLKAGARVDIQDNYGNTPLIQLLENLELSHERLTDCAQLLVRAGANYTTLKNNKQLTAQECARKRGIYLERLV